MKTLSLSSSILPYESLLSLLQNYTQENLVYVNTQENLAYVKTAISIYECVYTVFLFLSYLTQKDVFLLPFL